MSMNLLRLFGGRNATAPVARERLQILLAHERGAAARASTSSCALGFSQGLSSQGLRTSTPVGAYITQSRRAGTVALAAAGA